MSTLTSLALYNKSWYTQSTFNMISLLNGVHLTISIHFYQIHWQFYPHFAIGFLSQWSCLIIYSFVENKWPDKNKEELSIMLAGKAQGMSVYL